MHATLSTTSQEAPFASISRFRPRFGGRGREERAKDVAQVALDDVAARLGVKLEAGGSRLELLFPELESTASHVSDLLVQAQEADQSSVFRRQAGPFSEKLRWAFQR